MLQSLRNGLFLLLALGVLSVACCRQEVLDYANLRTVSLSLSEPAPSGRVLTTSFHTSVPELQLDVRPEYDYLAAAPAGGPLIGPAWAMSCEESGSRGLKDQVAGITLTSAGLFAGVGAGQPLNQFVTRSSNGPAGSSSSSTPAGLGAKKVKETYSARV